LLLLVRRRRLVLVRRAGGLLLVAQVGHGGVRKVRRGGRVGRRVGVRGHRGKVVRHGRALVDGTRGAVVPGLGRAEGARSRSSLESLRVGRQREEEGRRRPATRIAARGWALLVVGSPMGMGQRAARQGCLGCAVGVALLRGGDGRPASSKISKITRQSSWSPARPVAVTRAAALASTRRAGAAQHSAAHHSTTRQECARRPREAHAHAHTHTHTPAHAYTHCTVLLCAAASRQCPSQPASRVEQVATRRDFGGVRHLQMMALDALRC